MQISKDMRPAHVDGATENTDKQTLMALDKSHVFADVNEDVE